MSPLLFKRLSDESLGSRLASGEAAAFDELYRRYAHRLAAYGSHLLGDAASGDDVAQAAMLKAYGALRDGRVPDRMKPWLFRIAHNAAIDLVSRRREFSTETLPDQASGEREPFAGALLEALATLPDRQRRVYVLREVHGLRIDETGAELGLTASQVEQALFAARNRLAEQLVFGDRLNCVTVQRLAAGPLDPPERRALKTHLRACHECRQSMGLRGRALVLFPSGAGLEWLRGLGAGLLGGGAPAAAKVGAIFATATVVGGGTVAVEHTAAHHEHRAALHVVAAAPAAPRVATHAPAAVEVVARTPVRTAAVFPLHLAVSHTDDQRGTASHETDGTNATGDSTATSSDSRDGARSSGGGDSSEGGSQQSTLPASTTGHDGAETTTTRAEHRSGDGATPTSGDASSSGAPSSDGSSGDGASGDGSSGSGDHSDDPSPPTTTTTTTTTAAPVLPPPLPTVTVGTGD